jgi:cysteine desulfurase
MARMRIYLDHAATTPVLPEARAAMAGALEQWANPSSPHADGRAARAALEEARKTIAEALGWRHDVILTSGASEAIAIAASRAKVPGRALGPTEHDAVVAAMGPTAVQMLVDEKGVIDEAVLKSELSEGPSLIAIQHVNNETGVVQPLDAIAEKVREAGSLLLADCAQSAGKIALPDADFIAISAHKLGGPPGMGALLVKDIATLEPSGGQEKGYRRGTENVPAAAGLAAALHSRAFAKAMPRLAELRTRLEQVIVEGGGTVIAPNS